ncbi:MAG: HPF/RaiA family ribosome-associated protein [Anaerolineae bacterium]|nr:HPF/RaiA family ribosome-associated protein [Anaerolineae bacterium]
MGTLEFEFYNEAPLSDRVEAELRAEVERRLRALTEGHTDMTGASVAVAELTGDATPHIYEVRIVVYVRPEDVVAVEKRETAGGALKGALDAVERQVRELRARLRETWKQP